MNKNHHFSIFALFSGIILLLAAFAANAWTAHANTPAGPFIPGMWTKYPGNPVLNTGTSGVWDDLWIFGPGMILDEPTYKMWYTAFSTASHSMKIGYAESTNGTDWTKSPSNPVLLPGNTGSWDADGVSYPTVIKEDATHYKMWYTGVDASNVGRVGYATSSDGISWTKYVSNPVLNVGSAGAWDSTYVGQPSVIKVGATYKLWYRGGSATGGAIGYATSQNGFVWDKHDPAITGGSGAWDDTPYQPEVIFDGIGYHMWYSGEDQTHNLFQMGYATSPDGAQWTRKGMVLPQGAAGAWDDASADNAAVLQVGATLKMWYSGFHGQSYRILYATAPATILDHRIFLPEVIK